jgi:beta-glucosidase
VEQGCLLGAEAAPLAVALSTEFRDAEDAVVGTTVERDGRLLWFTEPVPGLDPDRFAFTARGTMRAAVGGTHRLTLTQAGRARVLVDGAVVLDGMTEPPPPGPGLFGLGSQQLVADLDLAEGQDVDVVVEYRSEGSFILHGVEVGHVPPAEHLLDRAVAAAAGAEVAVVAVGTSDTWESEGHDRPHLGLPGEQEELVRRVIGTGTPTVVVLVAGAPVDLACAHGAVALVLPWLGGEEAAPALADVLLGDAEPGGRLPVSWPVRLEHVPSYGSFPGEGDEVRYAEGLLTGYRWYDTRNLPVAFPFGHGRSYTRFSWGEPRLVGRAVEVAVTNTGTRRGAEVVQLYVEPPTGRLLRPRRELKGFQKLWLGPGETGTARLDLDDRALACWDPGRPAHDELQARLGDATVVPAGQDVEPREPGWWVEAGRYQLHVGASVGDLRGSVPLVVESASRLGP